MTNISEIVSNTMSEAPNGKDNTLKDDIRIVSELKKNLEVDPCSPPNLRHPSKYSMKDFSKVSSIETPNNEMRDSLRNMSKDMMSDIPKDLLKDFSKDFLKDSTKNLLKNNSRTFMGKKPAEVNGFIFM